MLSIARERAIDAMSTTNETAFLSAFDTYADALYRHALYRLSDPDRAADISQDTFIKTWDYITGGGDIKNWRAFLYRILNNLIIDEYRRHKNISLDALLEDDEHKTVYDHLLSVGSRRDKEERLDGELRIEEIKKMMIRLPEEYHTILTLRYLDDLALDEIAEILDISKNTASVRIHRAISELRKYCRQ